MAPRPKPESYITQLAADGVDRAELAYLHDVWIDHALDAFDSCIESIRRVAAGRATLAAMMRDGADDLRERLATIETQVNASVEQVRRALDAREEFKARHTERVEQEVGA